MTTRFVSTTLAALVLASCAPVSSVVGDPRPGPGSALRRFESCDEVQAWVADAWTEELIRANYGYGYWRLDDVAEGGEAADDSDGPSGWSETNTQEEGVDEPDVVESNGESIFVLQPEELTVVDAWPAADTAKLASLPLAGWSNAMLLAGDRMVVFGWDWDGEYATTVSLVDVGDPADPKLLRELKFDGWFVDARRIGDDIYTVLTTYGELPSAVWDLLGDGSLGLPEPDPEASETEQERIRGEARAILRPKVEERVEALPVSDLLPRFADREGTTTEERELLGCDELYHPASLSHTSTLSVVHVDVGEGAAGGEVSATGLLADGWKVYASTENLYVAMESWWWWWGYGELDLDTQIHRFSLDPAGPEYEASGEVPGWMLNSYAMDEHEDRLRVATTDVDWWWGTGETEDEGANNVFVLERSADDLVTVGSLRGIEPGEQLYAARFMDDRAFLVTFLQVDPLIAVDLSAPTSPRVAGILEVPGYSSYLHPIGTDRLLAVGMDGTEEGIITGLQVSVFDVGDLAAPSLVDRYVVDAGDGSYSEALWDPHAFTYYDGVLSLPMYSWDWDPESGETGWFSGLLVLDVDLDAGLTELGRVDHQDLVARSTCRYGYGYGYAEGDSADGGGSTGEDGSTDVAEAPCDPAWAYATVRRSVVVDDALYSISDYGMKVTDHRNPAEQIAEVLFWPLE